MAAVNKRLLLLIAIRIIVKQRQRQRHRNEVTCREEENINFGFVQYTNKEMSLAVTKYCLKRYEHQTRITFLGIYCYFIFERKEKFVILYVNVKYSFRINFIYFKKTNF